MVDVVDRETRSRMMRGIAAKDTKPEVAIRKALHSAGFRYSLHSKKMTGKPDIVLSKYKALIFVNGCFWHGHNCHLFKLPSTRTEFWSKKIQSNQARDKIILGEYKKSAWKVLTIWECAIKGKHRLDFQEMIIAVSDWIKNSSQNLEIRGK